MLKKARTREREREREKDNYSYSVLVAGIFLALSFPASILSLIALFIAQLIGACQIKNR